MSESPSAAALAKTPLAPLHAELGAKMVPFAGYEMPVSYPPGILAEHKACREQAALFDVSHMGQLLLHGADAAAALETLVPVDIVGLGSGKQRYALFTNAQGGILDDLMVTRRDDHLFVVVNAGNKAADLTHLEASIGSRCRIEPLPDRALLALQGPAAAAVMAQLSPKLAALTFMTGAAADIAGIACYATRSGYTGEDGFEISVAGTDAIALARALLAELGVAPAGLGARDTLRLEAGLCLHGNDIDATTTPIEAALGWAIQKVRRPGGERAGGYPGAAVIAEQLANGAGRKRVGLTGVGRMPVRSGSALSSQETGVGAITSGTLSPTLGRPVAMAYVDKSCATPGTTLHADVRGKPVAMQVATMPFVPHRYFRG